MESVGVGGGGGSVIGLEIISKCLQFISVGFNGAIIYTIWRKGLMRIPSTRFVFSLCLSHLLVSLMSLAISVVSFVSPQEPESVLSESEGTQPFCFEDASAIINHVLLYVTFGVAISTLITVTLISIERYITIARPMKYKSIVTTRRCFVAISLCWLLSALLVIFPIFFFNTNNLQQCGESPSVFPVGHMGWYFAVVFTVLTILTLSVMTVCYSHIFTIAKEKCQKVQIGKFSASAPASISSDWPSSVHSTVQGQLNHRDRGWFHSGSSRMTSSNSLLHWVLMANLRHHANPIRMHSAPKSPDLSPTTSIKSEPDQIINKSPGGSSRDPRLSRAKRKWRKYLQQNYNSPRKTVFTILALIGSVIVTQLPMSFVLFFPLDKNPLLFYFCHDLLFALSSLTNPILYGFLNRNIRDQLWKIFRPQKRRKNRQKRANSLSANISAVGELRDVFTPKTERIVINSRKGSLTSEDSNTSNGSTGISTVMGRMSNPMPMPATSSQKRRDTFIGLDDLNHFKLRKTLKRPEISHLSKSPSRKVSEGRVDGLEVVVPVKNGGEEGVEDGIVLEDEILQHLEFPRKPSQDSGADMTFSDEDQDQDDPEEVPSEHGNNRTKKDKEAAVGMNKVDNYLRIYGDFLDKKMKPKSKSDSDIINAPGLQDSLPKPNQIIIKSQCQLGPEMLPLPLALEQFRLQPPPPLSSSRDSRQNLLLGVQPSNGCNNCYSDDELLQCSSRISNYDAERGKDNAEVVICTDLIKIENVFRDSVSSCNSCDSSSSCTTDSDEDEEVKDHIEI